MSAQFREFAEDKVKQYINNNLSRFLRIQVKQMIHLQCFTDADRQEIRATCDREGNNQAVFIFFQCLCCRQGWVPLFIGALREGHMGDLADKLQGIYDHYLLPSPGTLPAASSPPAASIPSDPPLRPQAKEQGSHAVAFPPATPVSPLGFAPSTAHSPTQDTGDYHAPIQEDSHPAEKTELVVKPEAADKAREPDFPPPSNSNAASNIRAAVGGEKATDARAALPEKESPSIPGAVEEEPFLPPTASTSDAGSAEQKWDGRQHRPVTVKNGCFGNTRHPEDSVTLSALPAHAARNQPEEDYYSSDSFLLALGGQRVSEAKDLPRERKVHIIRGDRTQDGLENPAVADSLDAKGKRLPGEKLGVSPKASHRSAEDPPQLPSTDPLPHSPSANGAQLSLKRAGTKPSSQVPNTASDQQFRPPPSDLDGSSSIETMPPNPFTEFSAAGGDAYSDDFKRPIEEKKPLGETDSEGALAVGREQTLETRPLAVVDYKRKNRIFYSNCSENDMPSKPGVLSSVPDEAAEQSNPYSWTSERLCMSSSDPILVSDSSAAGNPTVSTIWGREGMNGAGDASLPPGDKNCEDDTSVRTHRLQVEKNPSMDLMGAPPVVPLGRASSHPSPGAFRDPTHECQPENKARDLSGASCPEEEPEAEIVWTANSPVLLFVGFALAAVAAVAFVLYKKK
ncbi:mitochondrial antiviral-signaling protein isoform X1 [Candoia aspera]|uniref:mitochondrial antiviral-signaling protein isoform X1 n=1 Tax=Candoia aspera TaxID=51853 RepID=UPI002FD81C66